MLTCDPAAPDAVATITAWLRAMPVGTLHVAGPSERSHPGIGEQAYALLVQVLRACR